MRFLIWSVTVQSRLRRELSFDIIFTLNNVAICSISTILSFWSPSMLIADVKISNLVLAMIMMICTGMTNIIYMLEECQFLEGQTQKLPGYKY